jgi:hypothetical protein
MSGQYLALKKIRGRSGIAQITQHSIIVEGGIQCAIVCDRCVAPMLVEKTKEFLRCLIEAFERDDRVLAKEGAGGPFYPRGIPAQVQVVQRGIERIEQQGQRVAARHPYVHVAGPRRGSRKQGGPCPLRKHPESQLRRQQVIRRRRDRPLSSSGLWSSSSQYGWLKNPAFDVGCGGQCNLRASINR